MADVAKVDQGGFVVDDDAAVFKSDEGDEEADTGTNGVAEVHGNGIDNPLTHFGECENDEDDTFEEDGGEGKLPGVAHAEAHREHEEGVKSHAGGKGEGLFGVDGHDEGTDDGGKRCGCEDIKLRWIL